MLALLRYSLLLFLLLFTLPVCAQLLDYRQGELIVQLQPEVNGKDWAARQTALQDARLLTRGLNAWLLSFDPAIYPEDGLKQQLYRDPAVIAIQYNHFVKFRETTPDDPLFPNQWQYNNTGQIGGLEGADANICPAWDITTGGLTVNGDTIVICAIDNGIDEDHEDLVPNLWINYDEIPDNGIDDDNNGFIDDRKGWNTAANNNDINGGSHGTSVAGIMGARGNNTLGVAGVNWVTKVMVIRNNFLAGEAEVLEAYGYALDARRDYDASGGTAGAYVVATNASWGIDGGNPDDSPIWCALYDTLGNYGILNAGATTNTNTDVDADGDLPTTCPSDFLLGVTNVNTNDERPMNAGFGALSIDLGAHGENVFTTVAGNNYGNFAGTSAATPMVTGAIGLLYSAPSPLFGELLTADPAAAALFVRQTILDNTRALPTLDGITVTGGVLDLGAAMNALIDIQNTCLAPTSMTVRTEGATALHVSWNVVSSVNSVNLRYREQGAAGWTTVSDVSSPYLIADLSPCSYFEVQLLSVCGTNVTAGESVIVETDGCCRRPEAFTLTPQGNFSIRIDFSDVLAAVNYQLRYRPTGTQTWTTQTVQSAPLLLDGLSNCTEYQVEIRSNCDTAMTGFGDRMTVTTSGCGTCLDGEYCTPAEANNADEWIALVNLGNLLVNESGAETAGYRNYGELTATTLARAATYPLQLQPDHDGNTFTETFRVWVDWDQNGFFSSGEIAADVVSTGGAVALGELTVPVTADLGSTRMRIAMRFNQPSGACPSTTFFGEIEDYCLDIVASPGCVPPTGLQAVYDEDSQLITISWAASQAPGGNYLLRYRADVDDPWTELMTTALSVTLDEFATCELFAVELFSDCENGLSDPKTTVFNSCSAVNENGVAGGDWQLSPNPARDIVHLNWSGTARLSAVRVYTLEGRLRLQSSQVAGESNVLELATLPAGVYLVEVLTDDGRRGVKRLIRQ